VLDPVSRASEVLFGLIMVLTFTLSLGATGSGREDVRIMLLGALGCNLAWAIIDAILYLMGAHGERMLGARTIAAIRGAPPPEAHRLILEHIPEAMAPALSAADLERMRVHLLGVPSEAAAIGTGRDDYLAAIAVFLFVFVAVLPVMVPFLVFEEVHTALRVSNGVAILLLFLTGFAFGRESGHPWRAGLSMVAVGLLLVAIALVLGG
jgi:hypothetical protein